HPRNLATAPKVAGERAQLVTYQRDRFGDSGSVRRIVQPAARAGRMGQGDRRRVAVAELLSDTLRDALQPQEPPGGKAADRNAQAWSKQEQLPLAPEGAELLLAGSRRAVAPAARRLARIAARDRGAVERPV